MQSVFRYVVAVLLVIVAGVCSSQVRATQVGVWQFNNNLNNAISGGSALSVNGGWTATYGSETIAGQPATVLSFPAMSNSQALDMPNNAGPNGTGGVPTKNNWSIVMDIKFPWLNAYTALWETGAIGANDADYFIRDESAGAGTYGSIGTTSQYAGTLNADTWTRVAVTVDSTAAPGTYTVTGYIDGVLAGAATTSTSPGGKEAIGSYLHLFTDNDLETAPGLVNSIAYYGAVLSAGDIGALGGPTASGIPSAPNQVGRWNFDNNLNNSIFGKASMSAVGGWTPTYASETISGSPATVLSFPPLDGTQALDMPNQATPDDFGDPTQRTSGRS